MNQIDRDECARIRKQIFITGYAGGMAHLASCFSAVEIIYTLYLKDVMKHKAEDPDWKERDRFILSKGHAGLALYAVLCKAGYLSEEEYRTYLKPGCRIGGEPCMRDLKGIEATTGALGHGLSMGIGMALAQKMDNLDAKTYVLLGDGECEEGSVWEAAMAASSFSLGNLVAILDCNQLQKMNRVDETLKTIMWREKWESFGWDVVEVDGHDVDALKNCFDNIVAEEKPTMVIAHTVKGKGVSIMEHNPLWHFKLPNKKELKVFKEELHISDEEME